MSGLAVLPHNNQQFSNHVKPRHYGEDIAAVVMLISFSSTTLVLRTLACLVAAAGQVVRLCMDPAGVLAICCHSDGCVRIYDLKTGQLAWRAWGHASYVAAAAFSSDLSQLVSVGGDGCIVVWQLPGSLTEQLQAALTEVAAAKEQEGCLPASTKAAPIQAGLTGAPAGAVGASTSRGAHTPQSSGLKVASTRTTPGSCVSDGGFGSTMKRIKLGKPLVSVERLPRWARSPSVASTAAVVQHTSEGGAGVHVQQQQQRPSKWLLRQRQSDHSEQGAVALSDPGAQVRKEMLGALNHNLTTVEH